MQAMRKHSCSESHQCNQAQLQTTDKRNIFSYYTSTLTPEKETSSSTRVHEPRSRSCFFLSCASRLARVRKARLTLKGEAGTELVGSLVELLGVEGATETQGNTLAEEDVVANGSDTAVVELDLGERDGVDAVLGGNLKADSVAGLGVPGSLGTGLNLAVDLVVVRGSEDAQVVSGGDGSAVLGSSVADSSAVAGDSSLLDIVASRGTSEETLVADDSVDVGLGALEEVEESTAVETGLLEVEVELSTLGSGGGEEVEETLELEALGEGVVDLNLGVQGVGGVPGLGQGKTCKIWLAMRSAWRGRRGCDRASLLAYKASSFARRSCIDISGCESYR